MLFAFYNFKVLFASRPAIKDLPGKNKKNYPLPGSGRAGMKPALILPGYQQAVNLVFVWNKITELQAINSFNWRGD
mgnify:FL=1